MLLVKVVLNILIFDKRIQSTFNGSYAKQKTSKMDRTK